MKIVPSEFSNSAWDCFIFAKEIAYKNYQQNVDSDNLLLALIKDDDITKKILKNNNVNLKQYKKIFGESIKENEIKALLENHKEKIIELEGFGEKSFLNLIDSINKSKVTTLSRYLFSLGLRYLGENNSELISLYFKNKIRFKNIIQSKKLREELENIDGLGEKAISSFINYFSDQSNLEESFMILDIIEIKDVEDEIMNICRTFSMDNKRQQQNLIETLKQNCRRIVKEKTGKKPFTNINITRI